MITRVSGNQNSGVNFKANFTEGAQSIINSRAKEFEDFPLMKTWYAKVVNDKCTSHIIVDIKAVAESFYKATATSPKHPNVKPLEIGVGSLKSIFSQLTGKKMSKITTEELPAVEKAIKIE